jgi:hypothetical protein
MRCPFAERVFEWRTGVRCGGLGRAASVTATVDTAEIIARRESAGMLQSMGFDFALCMKGLEVG